MRDLARHIHPEPNTGCWLWSGSVNRGGYGRVWYSDHSKMAHKVMWESANGPVPDGMELDHLCRVRCCVNPAHLEVVTPKENIMRGICRAAVNARKTHCVRGHAFSGGNLLSGRNGLRPRRRCRECIRIDSRNYRAARKAIR